MHRSRITIRILELLTVILIIISFIRHSSRSTIRITTAITSIIPILSAITIVSSLTQISIITIHSTVIITIHRTTTTIMDRASITIVTIIMQVIMLITSIKTCHLITRTRIK